MATATSDIAHLLRRTGFGGSAPQIAALAALNLPQVVDQVLNDASAPPPAQPGFVTDANLGDWERWQALGNWWFDRMAGAPVPLVEKATLFWHGHITAAHEKVGDVELLWQMHNVQRTNALGNIKTLAQACFVTPAMLLYLDNADNVKTSPNQNFARELLELFLLGVGNYSETDVDACALAWSGHNYDDDTKQYVFRADKHDFGPKTFMGVTRNWNGPELVDFLFTDPTQQVKVATHLSRRLWSFFAHPSPPANVVTDLANIMITSGFEMKPVLKAIFLRPEFYVSTAKQGLVRSPIEFLAAVMKATGVRSPDASPMQHAEGLGQEPFNPPNVSGWRPNKYWLSAGTAGEKASWAQNLHWHMHEDSRDIFRDLPAMPLPQAVDTLLSRVGITEVSDNSRAVVTKWLTQQRASNHGWFETFGLTVLVMLLPELQLA